MNIAIFLLSISMLLAPVKAAIPEEPIWSSILSAAVLVAYIAVMADTKPASTRRLPACWLVVAFVGWTLLTTVVHAGITKLAFLSHMLHMSTTVLTYGCAFFAMRRLATHAPGGAFVVALCAVAGGTIMSVAGVQEFITNIGEGAAMARINGTSTPDFLAGYLLLTIPISIAAFVAIPRDNAMFKWLTGLAAILQIAALFQSQSRFALISLFVGFVAFGVGVFRSNQFTGKGVQVSRAGVVAATLALLVLASPLIYRLAKGGDKNSAEFRQLTWHGTLDMAKAGPNSLIGAGPGTFIDHYPRFARAGFTRLAHNTYLQIAAEIGLPALIALLGLIIVTLAITWRFLASNKVADPGGPLAALAKVTSGVSGMVTAAILASIAAEATQNLIDSDLYVFSIGLTFFAITGLASGLTSTGEKAPSTKPTTNFALVKWAGMGLAAVGALYSVTIGVAAADAALAASTKSDPNASPADAGAAYEKAMTWAPLDGKYPAEYGYRVLIQGENSLPDGISQIKYSIERQPDALNYYRLGSVLQHTGDNAGAIAAYRNALVQDPNYLDALIALATITAPPDSLGYYRRIADIEQSPVGKVRAIGDMVEQHFAIGDVAVAADYAGKGDRANALIYDKRATDILEQYAIEDGSNFLERMAEHGGSTSPPDDEQAATLYDTACKGMLALLDGKEKEDFEDKKRYFDADLQLAIGDSYRAIGRGAEAKTAYENGLSSITGCTYKGAPTGDPAAVQSRLQARIQSLGQ